MQGPEEAREDRPVTAPLPHRFSSPPLPPNLKNCPLRSRSPLPPRVPHPHPRIPSGSKTRPPARGDCRARDARTRVKGAGRRPRRALSVLRAARPRRPAGGWPPQPPEVGSLSCGGGSQLLHIWLHYTFTYWSEQASERERARGRAAEGGREEEGGEGEEEERAVSIPQTSFLLQWRSRTGPVSLQGDPKQASWSSSQSYSSRKTLFPSSAPPSPRNPRSIYTLQQVAIFFLL